MSEKIHLIVGHEGQDGRLLREYFDEQGKLWIGVGRRGVACSAGLNVGFERIDVRDEKEVGWLMREVGPREVYYLAAHHHASVGKGSRDREVDDLREGLECGFDVNVRGVVNFLDAIERYVKGARLFYASSSLVYGAPRGGVRISESTVREPSEVYGVEKLYAMQMCEAYRKRGVYAAVGMLFNHESIYRKPMFFTRKVVDGVARIKLGLSDELVVGDMNAVVDWLYAGDVVKAMVKVLGQCDEPREYVIASGVGHCTGDFVRHAFECVGLEMEKYVRSEGLAMRRRNSGRVGDASRIMSVTDWRPGVCFEELVETMTAQAIVLQERAHGSIIG
ncbi:GDP-mannose 4,6-dehydratase [Poriferisphaera corsica]|uniref:GDP-mannose 4,6-dehydratase n=1 Tax=Poriferisphaera corsica TaxID=2528020 RepID=A0A517YPB9_9BACT|nr:GDP-mannose 4,6-dehydratase [Poriferisphaera corsica]QDU32056.1 GDP-mannose 4,6-dehydratase [Poriferisphaera corsica]